MASVTRAGKQITLLLDNGRPLTVKFGMTGQLLFPSACPELDDHHVHVRMGFAKGGDTTEVVYRDVRRFGRIELWRDAAQMARERKMGRDALWFDSIEDLASVLWGAASSRRKATVWGLLMDQSVVAGMGNYLSSEIPARAGIHPLRRCNELSRKEFTALAGWIVKTIRMAIKNGGFSMSNFIHMDGTKGRMGRYLRVYGREGLPCRRHKNVVVEKRRFHGRSVFYCPVCQRV